MNEDASLLPGRLLRRAGPPGSVAAFEGVHFDDSRLESVLSHDATLLVLHDAALHAEGPQWQPQRDRLVFSDVSNRRLLAWHPDGRVEVVIDGTYFMNGNAIDREGRLVHCEHGRRCISRSGADAAADGKMPTPLVTHYRGRRLNSPNDLAMAPDGTIWFTDPEFGLMMPSQGSLADPELDHRSVYRFEPRSGALTRMADFEQPNGIAFSADGRTLYVSDTSLALGGIPGTRTGTRHEIVVFDVADDGSVSDRRFFCQTDHGCPDGFVVDRRGWVWVSAADGVHVWSADRERLGFIRTPAVVSNCTFGGEDDRRLFITAAQYLFAIDLIA